MINKWTSRDVNYVFLNVFATIAHSDDQLPSPSTYFSRVSVDVFCIIRYSLVLDFEVRGISVVIAKNNQEISTRTQLSY